MMRLQLYMLNGSLSSLWAKKMKILLMNWIELNYSDNVKNTDDINLKVDIFASSWNEIENSLLYGRV